MQELVDAGLEIQQFFEKQQWKFCFIGGLALLHWGEPRFTQDVDLTLYTGFENEEAYISQILSHYPARIENMADFAAKNRILLVETSSGIPIDIALGGLPFEKELIEKSLLIEFLPGKHLRICGADYLIIQKAFASRPQDWIDIEGILHRQNKLNWEIIFKHLEWLSQIKEAPEIVTRLENIRNELC